LKVIEAAGKQQQVAEMRDREEVAERESQLGRLGADLANEEQARDSNSSSNLITHVQLNASATSSSDVKRIKSSTTHHGDSGEQRQCVLSNRSRTPPSSNIDADTDVSCTEG